MTRFSEMDLDRKIVDALRRMDVNEPTPIQEACIVPLIQGRDIVGQARTGSGKTLAFSIPAVVMCDADIASAQALILVPTRELAGQVARVIDKLAPARGLRVAQVYGGRDMGDQIALLHTGPQIIIGTPGRILDHLYRGSLALRHLRCLVLDEADQMLDQGFAPDVERILDCAPQEGVQMALFSATVPAWVHDVISHRLHDPEFIAVDEAQKGPNESIEHTVVEVPGNRKLDALRMLLEERGDGNVLIFCRTKIGVERLASQVSGLGFRVEALQGNMSQGLRERVLRGFRRGNPPILVATNVAARGLDVLSIEQVINFDLPENAELLTHRLGRTGRMGRHGSAVTLLTPNDVRSWKVIETAIGLKIQRECWTPDGIQHVGEHAPQIAEPTAAPIAARSSSTATSSGAPEQRPEGEARRPTNRRAGATRPRHEVTCAQCGRQTTVSFVPSEDRPVYCGTCFRQRKETTAA